MGKVLQTAPEAAESPNTAPVVRTLDEAAAILRVRKSWLERQAAARKIPFTMLGGAYHFTAEHIVEIIQINEKLPTATEELRAARRRTQGWLDSETVTMLRPRPRPDGPRRKRATA